MTGAMLQGHAITAVTRSGATMERAAAVFLPGILMPALFRYAPLREELDDSRVTLMKELEIYAGDAAPADYSIATEVVGLDRFADHQGLDRFHLYGHSAGAAIALAYVAAHPDRLSSLALDEPASDFSDADRRAIQVDLPADLGDLPEPERMSRFARSLVRPDVDPPTLAPPGDSPEMAKRPPGLVAFSRALFDHELDHARLGSFAGPVYFSYGSLSNERWEAMAERLREEFRTCTVERYEGIHHLNPSHMAEPGRVAAALERLWADAETT